MNKKRFLAALAVATLAFSMVGCGSSGGGDSKGSDSGVANKDKPLCWFNRQPSNSSTGELDKEALSFNDDTYYVIRVLNFRARWYLIISKRTQLRWTVTETV